MTFLYCALIAADSAAPASSELASLGGLLQALGAGVIGNGALLYPTAASSHQRAEAEILASDTATRVLKKVKSILKDGGLNEDEDGGDESSKSVTYLIKPALIFHKEELPPPNPLVGNVLPLPGGALLYTPTPTAGANGEATSGPAASIKAAYGNLFAASPYTPSYTLNKPHAAVIVEEVTDMLSLKSMQQRLEDAGEDAEDEDSEDEDEYGRKRKGKKNVKVVSLETIDSTSPFVNPFTRADFPFGLMTPPAAATPTKKDNSGSDDDSKKASRKTIKRIISSKPTTAASSSTGAQISASQGKDGGITIVANNLVSSSSPSPSPSPGTTIIIPPASLASSASTSASPASSAASSASPASSSSASFHEESSKNDDAKANEVGRMAHASKASTSAKPEMDDNTSVKGNRRYEATSFDPLGSTMGIEDLAQSTNIKEAVVSPVVTVGSSSEVHVESSSSTEAHPMSSEMPKHRKMHIVRVFEVKKNKNTAESRSSQSAESSSTGSMQKRDQVPVYDAPESTSMLDTNALETPLFSPEAYTAQVVSPVDTSADAESSVSNLQRVYKEPANDSDSESDDENSSKKYDSDTEKVRDMLSKSKANVAPSTTVESSSASAESSSASAESSSASVDSSSASVSAQSSSMAASVNVKAETVSSAASSSASAESASPSSSASAQTAKASSSASAKASSSATAQSSATTRGASAAATSSKSLSIETIGADETKVEKDSVSEETSASKKSDSDNESEDDSDSEEVSDDKQRDVSDEADEEEEASEDKERDVSMQADEESDNESDVKKDEEDEEDEDKSVKSKANERREVLIDDKEDSLQAIQRVAALGLREAEKAVQDFEKNSDAGDIEVLTTEDAAPAAAESSSATAEAESSSATAEAESSSATAAAEPPSVSAEAPGVEAAKSSITQSVANALSSAMSSLQQRAADATAAPSTESPVRAAARKGGDGDGDDDDEKDGDSDNEKRSKKRDSDEESDDDSDSDKRKSGHSDSDSDNDSDSDSEGKSSKRGKKSSADNRKAVDSEAKAARKAIVEAASESSKQAVQPTATELDLAGTESVNSDASGVGRDIVSENFASDNASDADFEYVTSKGINSDGEEVKFVTQLVADEMDEKAKVNESPSIVVMASIDEEYEEDYFTKSRSSAAKKTVVDASDAASDAEPSPVQRNAAQAEDDDADIYAVPDEKIARGAEPIPDVSIIKESQNRAINIGLGNLRRHV
ncbi:hypothetical protein EV174_003336 [Coemansia sp. RSA 2320]|nr:hypothetical protein EV174_003336 [Coemansia sp. RSA 2320]